MPKLLELPGPSRRIKVEPLSPPLPDVAPPAPVAPQEAPPAAPDREPEPART